MIMMGKLTKKGPLMNDNCYMGEILVKSEETAADANLHNDDLFSIDDVGADIRPTKDAGPDRLHLLEESTQEECLSRNKRLVVKLCRLPDADAHAVENTSKMDVDIEPRKDCQNKGSIVKKNPRLPRLPSISIVYENPANNSNQSNHSDIDVDVDQLIKDCHDKSKRLVIVLERIPIIDEGETRHRNINVKVNRHKLDASGAKKPSLKTSKSKIAIKNDDQIICLFCQKEFMNYSSRRTHYEVNHKTPWTCKFPNCQKIFTVEKKTLYVFHQLTHEVDNFKHFWDQKMCPICKKQYEDTKVKEFRKHIMSHNYIPSKNSKIKTKTKTSKKEQIVCNKIKCDKLTAKKSALDRHKRLKHIALPGVKCKDCNKIIKSSLQDHQRAFHQTFQCSVDDCNLTFKGKKKLDDHLTKEHKISCKKALKGQFVCDICSKSFKDNYGLNRHQIVHSNSPATCQICSKVFKNIVRLKSHQYVFHKAFKCNFGNCTRTYGDQSKLDAHLRKHEESWMCEICSIILSNIPSIISSHMWNKHKVLKCPVDGCKAEFNTETRLLAHEQAEHDPEKKPEHLCSSCGLSFWIKKTLDKHRKLFHVEGRYVKNRSNRPSIRRFRDKTTVQKCKICQKEFRDRSNLVKHEQYHNKIEQRQKELEEYDGPKFSCSFCNKIYTKSKSLVYHMEMVHTKKPVFKCEFENCDKIFNTKRSLNNHMTSIHLKIKIECMFCKMNLTSKSQLAKHLFKVHKKERDYPFKCNVAGCVENFYRNKFLQDHIEQVHKNSDIC